MSLTTCFSFIETPSFVWKDESLEGVGIWTSDKLVKLHTGNHGVDVYIDGALWTHDHRALIAGKSYLFDTEGVKFSLAWRGFVRHENGLIGMNKVLTKHSELNAYVNFINQRRKPGAPVIFFEVDGTTK